MLVPSNLQVTPQCRQEKKKLTNIKKRHTTKIIVGFIHKNKMKKISINNTLNKKKANENVKIRNKMGGRKPAIRPAFFFFLCFKRYISI